MGIFSRFTDIVNANLNSLLDKAEDPQKMVRLIIQEMEETLVEVRSGSARTLADKKELVRRIGHLEEQSADWQDKAELAISKGRDDLAKAALVEKRRTTEQAELLKQELITIEAHLARLTEEVQQLQEKLQDARNRQKTLLMRQETMTSRREVKRQLDSGKIEQAMNRFDNYEQRLDTLESELEAYDLAGKTLQDQFRELAAEEKLQQELDALKARMNKRHDA